MPVFVNELEILQSEVLHYFNFYLQLFTYRNAAHGFHESPEALTAHDLEEKAPLRGVKGIWVKRLSLNFYYSF